MIIVRLKGGLGNQLFQYATARTAAERNNSTLKLDILWFDDPKHIYRKYRLNKFNIVESFVTPGEVDEITWKSRTGLKKRIFDYVQRRMPYYRRKIVQEQNFYFDPNVARVLKNVYLDGYWQSEKYFKDIENILPSEFSLKTPLDKMNQTVLNKITQTEPVSIHVRHPKPWCRDPQTNPDNIEFHGTCSLEYYHAAVKKISMEVKNPHFFVFSDNMDWTRDNLKYDLPLTFVDHNGEEKDYKDLHLMSHCKHNIIANSTFSWWGAWLNKNPDKIVIAPKKWFADEKMNNQTQDLIPETWIRL